MRKVDLTFIFLFISLFVKCVEQRQPSRNEPDWRLGPFVKIDSANPIMESLPEEEFFCPVRKSKVQWEAKDVFNPAAVVKDGKIYLLYRAEDTIGKFAGTSRIGIAWSTDGMHFSRESKPVLYPDRDFMKKYEWEGGCEDPRIVQDETGIYYMTYTAFNGMTARLCVAVSKDLYKWEKKGLAFANAKNGMYESLWSKSGSIVCHRVDETNVACKINGTYWMYWGESNIYLATSDDLINWTPVEKRNEEKKLLEYTGAGYKVQIEYAKPYLFPVLTPRRNRFDSILVEPGPPAIVTPYGILLIYNAANDSQNGDSSMPAGSYSAGQVLFDVNDPASLIGRMVQPFMVPEREYEKTGQMNYVCFLEGLVFYQSTWWLYYGCADSKIAVARFTP